MKKKSDITNIISNNIRKYRKINNLTQAQLAEKLYLDTQYFAQLERGERSFTIEKLLLACNVFQIGIEKIITVKSHPADNTDLIQSIEKSLLQLDHNQLLVVEKFINEIVPFIG